MSDPTKRCSPLNFSDLIMWRNQDAQWNQETVKVSVPSSIAARPLIQSVKIGGEWSSGRPEVYKIKIAGTWAEDNTLKITLDGTDWETFTAKNNPTIASKQFSAGGTGEVIVADIMGYIGTSHQPTNWIVTADGDELVFTYKDNSSGKYITDTVSAGSAGTAVVTNTQNYQSGDTITISNTTYTCKASPSTESGTTEFGPNYTSAQIAKVIADDPLTITNFTITNSGDKVLITQTTAGTGTALTASDVTVTGNNGSAVLATEQEYTPASSEGSIKIKVGEPLSLVSKDSEGVKSVYPTSVGPTPTSTISTLCGFSIIEIVIKAGDTVLIPMVNGEVRFNTDLMLNKDLYGNSISWDYASGSIREKAEQLNFQFGHGLDGLHTANGY